METSRRPTKRLLVFDRRYGWVIDEWKDPSEEALAGGRGMFCVVPLAKASSKTIWQSINLIAKSTINFLERPDILSPQVLQANLNDQLQKVVSSTKRSGFDMVLFRKNSTCESTTRAPSLRGETSESHSVGS